jgi:hypothetical protein
MNRVIAMCNWDACGNCGWYTEYEECVAPGDLEVEQDGDSILCMSAKPITTDGGEARNE